MAKYSAKYGDKRTINRLVGVSPDQEGVLSVLVEAEEGLLGETHFKDLDVPGAEAAVIWGNTRFGKAHWTGDASRLVAEPLDYESRGSGMLLVAAIDQDVYAIGFGQGHRLVPARFKDQTFGLRFAVRAIDATTVREVTRRELGGRGRADATYVPSGIPIGQVGLSEYTELVRKLAGTVELDGVGLTVEGSAGLRMRHPLEPAELVGFLRRLAAVCARPAPPELAFVEAIQPVADADVNARLDRRLADGLRGGDPGTHLSVAVPTDLLAALDETRSYRTRIGPATGEPRSDLLLEDILARCRVIYSTPLLDALRAGEIRMHSDGRGTDIIGRAPAIRWLEAAIRLDERQFFLMEGGWFEAGTEYFASVQRQIAGLFPATPSLELPAWRKGTAERCYNLKVQHDLGRSRYLCLDRRGVRSAFHGANGFEPCDLLGPANELIHVKGADGSGPLSHLFNQALISTEALLLSEDARKEFALLVERTSDGTRTLPPSFRPHKVVFAVMLRTGRTCSPQTLFPFAQVSLAHMARTLRHRFGIDIEVIAIRQA